MTQQSSQAVLRTRARVLQAVLDHGPITAASIARQLDLTAAAIRRHLDALTDEGAIEVRDLAGAKTGRGRPARHYVVSSAGHSRISDSYDELTVEALEFLEDKLGTEAIDEFARQRISELMERVEERVGRRSATVAGRSRDLAAALNDEGYAASAIPVAVGTPLEAMQLCQGHCPIHKAAARYPQFCEAELDAFSEFLGVDIRRLSTLAAGGHLCNTHVPTSDVNRPLIDAPDQNQGGAR
ncbi:helix-turn-helix transcriptional regulator [Brevibacterium ravenspurgense]|uniref:helix-turn-helix transcriptional regulator n=1 Tax=Brevibacterium ravenspurgense TaxID=479117 RepID=UPI000780387F|nr:helix-turn-helix domain-containing protein [Brevibacterium ravenspurgense]